MPGDGHTIYQHPLAYLLGLEGIALLHAFDGDHGREFTHARLAEVRALLEREEELGDGVVVEPIPTTEGYRSWAEFYDEPGNDMIEIEQPLVREILDGLPAGVALDAACGTGRHAAYLAERGHTVIGVDSSPEMLARARAKVPGGEFHEVGLHALPLHDGSVDLVVCGLALMHVPELDPVLAEFARVLRPGGDLVVSDWRALVGGRGFPVVKAGADGSLGYMPTRNRRTSEYLAAALRHGFRALRCEEPLHPEPLVDESGASDGDPPPAHRPGRAPNRWALHPYAVDAANAAFHGAPIAIVWHFRLVV